MHGKKGQIAEISKAIGPLVVVGIVLVVGFLIFAEIKSTLITEDTASLCSSGEELNNSPSDYSSWQCCNATSNAGATEGMNCNKANGNGTVVKWTSGINGTNLVINATSEIPQWLSIFIVVIIGGILVFMVQRVRNQA